MNLSFGNAFSTSDTSTPFLTGHVSINVTTVYIGYESAHDSPRLDTRQSAHFKSDQHANATLAFVAADVSFKDNPVFQTARIPITLPWRPCIRHVLASV